MPQLHSAMHFLTMNHCCLNKPKRRCKAQLPGLCNCYLDDDIFVEHFTPNVLRDHGLEVISLDSSSRHTSNTYTNDLRAHLAFSTRKHSFSSCTTYPVLFV